MRLGLFNRISSRELLEEELEKMVAVLRHSAPASIAALKRLTYAGPTSSFENQRSAELAAFVECASTEDFREGVKAFSERRSPVFKGK